ncbi:hypothetical protein [Aliivibrio salmonicida]|uniref:hypothetical protein n=1 Tax=Aliivibrio salmonicida TaxID=40269 RepID=UPI003D0BB887
MFEPSNQYALNFSQEKLSPQNTMLVKIFLATDAFIIELNKALFNGELNREQKQAYQNGILNDLTAFLMKLNKTCIEFHKLRKNQFDKDAV